MNIGKVQPREISDEMREAYLDYAMSVIVSRALPDVRDGLKPVHRRILYTMHEMGLRHNVKFRKSAAVVGDVLGKYHPHGDMAVYDSMARMAQEFSLRYPLVNGQGNWGCFTKGTKIKLTDGRSLTFGELVYEQKQGKRHWGFSFNTKDQAIEIAEITKPRPTRKDAKLVEVTLDNGENIRCTPDHRFMLRDGTYQEAQYLKEGDSLMPLYVKQYDGSRDKNLKGYEVVFQPFLRVWKFAHHLADDWNLKRGIYTRSAGRVRHHLDFNKYNNNPSNIKRLYWREHWKAHYEMASWRHKHDPEYVQKLAEGRRNFIKNNPERLSKRASERNRKLWKNPQYCATRIAAVKALWKNLDYRKFMSENSRENLKALWQRPDFQKLMSSVKSQELKELWKDSEYRAKMERHMARISKKIWEDPAHRVYISSLIKQIMNDPTRKAYQSKVSRLLWRNPAYRAKYPKDHFQAMARALWAKEGVKEMHRKKAKKQWQEAGFRERFAEGVRRRNKERLKENPNYMKELGQKAAHSLREKWQEPSYKSRVMRSKILRYISCLVVQGGTVSPELYDAARKNNGIPRAINAARYFGGFRKMLEEAKTYNHKVVHVRFLQQREDVYDITVEPWHNFALDAGIFVHNSIDGDAPAAMRYTEARMTKIAGEMLKDIDKDTVEWTNNYDSTRKEPKVLPSAVPQLLINGTMGIAVGMATNIPPHNMTEVMDALIYLIDNPNASVADMLKFVKGPDFPTGGMIYGRKNMREAYAQGRGPIVMRGVADISERSPEGRKDDQRIEITEIPYQVNKSALIEKMADLVKEGKIEGIKDLRDESDRDGMSIVIELKKDAYPQKILNSLYKFTELQKTFHLNMLALVDGIQPQVLSIRDVLAKYLEHRYEVVRRRIEFDLARAKERAHILEGLKKALDIIDAVIKTIKASQDRDEAHKNLCKTFKFTEIQAAAILEMRLATLANLERKKIEDELEEKRKIIKNLAFLLANKASFLKLIKEEFTETKNTYGDKRKTAITAADAGEISDEDLIPKEETIISLTKGGYIKRVSPAAYKLQKRGGKGIVGMETKGEDVVEHFLFASTHDRLLFFTAQGKVYQTVAYEIPKSTRIGRGRALANFLELEREDFVTAILSLEGIIEAAPQRRGEPRPATAGREPAQFLVMATKHGIIKKTAIEDFKNVRKSGLGAIHLKNGDVLKWVGITYGKNDLLLTTANGQAIRFKETDVRPMGRSAAGVRAIHLKGEDEVISMIIAGRGQKHMLIISENGFGKRVALSLFKIQHRGGSGIKAAKITTKTGKIVAARAVEEDEDEVIAVSQKGQVIRTPLKNISLLGRATQGVKIMKLGVGDKVASTVSV